jgi:hypothetical protein
VGNRIVNYDGGITASPRQLACPASVEDIQSVLRNTKDFPAPVRAMGSYHSLTPCASSDGTIIDMSRMNRVVKIDSNAMTFTAQAGLQFIDASKILRRQGLQFRTNVEIGNLTLGSAACCHTKDALDGAEFGQVNSYVTEIKWVTPAGDLAQASETEGLDLLRLVRSSYGLCGVIYEITFRIKRLEVARFTYLVRPIDELTQQEVNQIINSAEGLICWTVGRTAIFQTRRLDQKPSLLGSWVAAGRRGLWNGFGASLARFIDLHVPTAVLKDVAHDGWFAAVRGTSSILSLAGGWAVNNPDKIIDYSRTRPSARYAFTFWAFPRNQWLETLRKYLAFADEHFKTYGFRCNMPLGSYFIRQDKSSKLSYTHDGDIFSIDPIHAYTDRAAWARFLVEFNEFADKQGGIPLLNQSPFVTRQHVQRAYGGRWQEFSDWVRGADPTGRMLNPFFASLLG